MKYKFHENIKHSAKVFPFEVEFYSDYFEGVVIVESHNAVHYPDVDIRTSDLMHISEVDELINQLQIYLAEDSSLG